jgi:GntR family transcriptional regulator
MQDPNKPVYLRLREVIAAAILDGQFAEGDMLPSVRALAAEQGANPLTVAKAYQTFQDDGLITVRRGVGMFVAAGAQARLKTVLREEFLQQVWPPVHAQMLRIGINPEDLLSGKFAAS